MIKSLLTTAAVAASVLLSASASAGVIVNIDSTVFPNGQTVNLAAGDYRIDPIIDDYTAWNAWGDTPGCDSNGENCTRGWIHRYFIDSTELGEIAIGSAGDRFETAIQAFNNASPFFFTLTSADMVELRINDSAVNDNLGGVSLEINRVSEPATLALLGLGLAGVAAGRRRR